MKNNPIFSIIMPCYNSAKTVEKTINSILEQSFTNFELIAINDGSTDNTIAILNNARESDNRIKIVDKSNEGVSIARNCGLDIANGEWITFCDSDDIISKDWLMIFYDCLQYNVDLVSQGYILSSNRKLITKSLDTRKYNDEEVVEWINKAYENYIWGFLWCKAFKKSIIKRNDIFFNSKLNFQEDLEFILNYISYCKTIYNTSKAEYIYITNGLPNKYRAHRKFESSKLCIEHLNKISNNKYDILNLLEYFQILMIEDIFIAYYLKDKKKEIKKNILYFRQIFNNDINYNKCLGPRRKIFYYLYKLSNFEIMNLVMKLMSKFGM